MNKENIYIDGISQNIIPSTSISKLLGKKINCLGDSFTASNVFSWWHELKDRTGCIPLNFGVSSSRISKDYIASTETDESGVLITDNRKSFLNRVSELDETADITVIFGGINDTVYLNSGLITLGNINSNKDTDTFYGALMKLIEDIKLRLPGKKIIGVIPPQFEQQSWRIPLMKQVQNACREVYEKYQIPYADLAKNCQEMYIDDYNVATFRQTTNNYHPSTLGYKAICDVIQDALESNIKS